MTAPLTLVPEAVKRVKADIARLRGDPGHAARFGTPSYEGPLRWNDAFAADLEALLSHLKALEAENETLRDERQCLAGAIGDAVVKAGMIRADHEGLTGPHLMQFVGELADAHLDTSTQRDSYRKALEPFAKVGRALTGRIVEYTVSVPRGYGLPLVEAKDFQVAAQALSTQEAGRG